MIADGTVLQLHEFLSEEYEARKGSRFTGPLGPSACRIRSRGSRQISTTTDCIATCTSSWNSRVAGIVDLTAHDLDASVSSTDPVSVLTRDSFDIKAIPVHHSSAPTLAHQVNSDDSSIAVVTDISSATDNLKRLASGTDVLDPRCNDSPDLPSDDPLIRLHSSPRQIGENARAADAQTLVLAHLTPQIIPSLDRVVETIQGEFDGDVVVAEDLMTVDSDGSIE